MHRRTALALVGSSALWASGCTRRDVNAIQGGFIGSAPERGHGLRQPWPDRAPDVTRSVHTVIAGGGIAGLAAARALRLLGRDDFALLELEDEAGGNSRGTQVLGLDCPQGAHYLPLPGDDAPEVQDWLEELGLRRRVAGRWQYDERHLCHSPQERLFFQGQWQDGLLPLQDVGAATLQAYRRFGQRVDECRRAAHYALPVRRSSLAPLQRAQDGLTFAAWLQREQLTDPHLRWYLDYSCRDDYGAGIDTVSAWAGIHYFASRHGFRVPGEADAERDAVLTWPEGNAWLARRLAVPLGERLRTARLVRRITSQRHGVTVDALDVASGRLERWQARRAIVALPLHVAARVLDPLPARVREVAARAQHAAWLVANLRLDAPLHDRPGAAPSWDNVRYGGTSLGYVDAMHQSLQPVPGATVLTEYRALGVGAAARSALLDTPWTHWRDRILAEWSSVHPDLAARTLRIELTRHGHAMRVPVPGVLQEIATGPLWNQAFPLSKSKQSTALTLADAPRLLLAHADWSGYSVLEEAFTLGHAAGTSDQALV